MSEQNLSVDMGGLPKLQALVRCVLSSADRYARVTGKAPAYVSINVRFRLALLEAMRGVHIIGQDGAPLGTTAEEWAEDAEAFDIQGIPLRVHKGGQEQVISCWCALGQK